MEAMYCDVRYERGKYRLFTDVDGDDHKNEVVLGTTQDESFDLAKVKAQRLASRSGRKAIVRFHTRKGDMKGGATFVPKG